MSIAMCWATLAVVAALLSALVSLLALYRPSAVRLYSMPLLGLCGLAASIAGAEALIHPTVHITQWPLGLPWLPWQWRLDALSGFFLLIIGTVLLPIAFYGPSYVRGFEHAPQPPVPLGVFTGLFIAGMLMVVLADGAFAFMVAWELMSLSSYFLVAFHHENAANRRAAFLYLLMAHVGGLCILLSFGVLAGFGEAFSFDAMRVAELSDNWATVAFILAFIGFGMKAGLVPLHVWLPEAHPVAPSHISALMSGVMLKVAAYGFIRITFDLIGDVQWGWGVAVLIIGTLSALFGILSAMMQHQLKRLLAYSSAENMGIVFIGLGMSLIFLGKGHSVLGTLGLVAALYHALNHAVFKSLLFLGAGAILHSTHEHSLDNMGGLLRRMPWVGWCFLVGCIGIAGLPPFNGFVSEWLSLQTALQAWTLENGILRTLLPLTSAILALTGALAVACFIKVYGTAFLGQARSRHVRRARRVGIGMRIGLVWLAMLCLLLGIFATQVVQLLSHVGEQLLGQGLPQATAQGWLWLTPMSAETASYSAPLVLIGLLISGGIAAWALRRGEVRRVRRRDAWDCGFSAPTPRMQISASGFSSPFLKVFANWFRIKETVDTDEQGQKRHQLTVDDPFWAWIYLPIARVINAASRRVTLLQSGHVRTYLGWSLGTLIVLLWIIS